MLLLAGIAPFLSACGLADRGASASETPPQANAGEQQGTIPAAARPAPADPAASPQQALERFAGRYINWSYRTLAAEEAALAAEAVGEARAFEEQARAQTVRDTPLQRGHIYNTGTIIALARVRGGPPDEWVIDTREQTGGDQEYAGLQATFHVTLATVARVGKAYAVSSWRPVE
ncbi:MAG TPA: hypothetical protein VNV37_08590 [Solirubrobacteraceae bacterium]|nr:hypothetical protein [Solirubrobacteraceae bacterium]